MDALGGPGCDCLQHAVTHVETMAFGELIVAGVKSCDDTFGGA